LVIDILRRLFVSDQNPGRRVQLRTPLNTSPNFFDQSIFHCEWQYIQMTFTILDFETQFFMLLIEQSPMDINLLPMNDSFPIVGIRMML
jgi:hypothetical protein